jgi:UDP-N-acetylglucosamine transferase subunit ALG13
VILVTVGTHHQPFTRLIRALRSLPSDELVVQYGHSPPPAWGSAQQAVPFLAYDQLAALMDAADVVVTHAGVGSVLTALRMGHTPIVVPRLARFNEHVDDHQVELTQTLEETGRVIAVWEIDELASSVASVPPRTEVRSNGTAERLHAAVRMACLGDLGDQRPEDLEQAPDGAPELVGLRDALATSGTELPA